MLSGRESWKINHRKASMGAVNSAVLFDSLHAPTKSGSSGPVHTGPHAEAKGEEPAVGDAEGNSAKPQPAHPR
eukprot:9270775-Pyramimonas_sp.AAC.1